ncbi:MAG TPA: hypothetical protein VM925_36010 [Labilithrix sp.]|jgi:hypothetical protein|nr:hypothetical protein [Labilithrix sp.]
METGTNKGAVFSFGRAWLDDELDIMRLTFVPRAEISLKEAIEQ